SRPKVARPLRRPDSCAALSESGMSGAACRPSGSAPLLAHQERPVAVARELEQDEFERLGGRDAYLREQLAGVNDVRRVERLVAAHEERLLLGRAAERARAVEPSKVGVQLSDDFGAQ